MAEALRQPDEGGVAVAIDHFTSNPAVAGALTHARITRNEAAPAAVSASGSARGNRVRHGVGASDVTASTGGSSPAATV